MDERILISQACVDEGLAWLARDPVLAPVVLASGVVPIRQRDGGFTALLSAIVSQQVSVASANAIWARLEAAGLTDMAAVAACDDAALRANGLSRQKARYALALAGSGVDFDALRDQPTRQVIETLTAVTGIGVWTAEIYAMFSLGRADIFPAADLALQEAARLIYGLDDRPREKALREMTAALSPWRTVAAKLFWRYYAVCKEREGIAV